MPAQFLRSPHAPETASVTVSEVKSIPIGEFLKTSLTFSPRFQEPITSATFIPILATSVINPSASARYGRRPVPKLVDAVLRVLVKIVHWDVTVLI